jgi:FkbM family methyltransferase
VSGLVHDRSIAAPILESGRILEQTLFEKYLVDRVAHSSHLLDIGSHVGAFVLMATAVNLHLKVAAFEAHPRLYDLLAMNLKQNHRFHQVCIHQALVGHRSLQTTLDGSNIYGENLDPNDIEHEADFSSIPIGNGGPGVPMVSLDPHDMPRCDFMRINSPGHERLVVDGCMDLLSRQHPTIFIRVTSHNLGSLTKRRLGLPVNATLTNPLAPLRELGYRTWFLDGEWWLCVYPAQTIAK